MTDINLPALIAACGTRWQQMRITPDRLDVIDAVAARLIEPIAKARYRDVANETGVPWFVVAVIHEREASQNWLCSIAQGDSWKRPSTHVPKGRGPFTSWESAALDALINCAPFASKWKDWSSGGALALLEQYNGEGYEIYHHIPSPYLWAGTNQYLKGKYTSDGKFDPNAVDTQIGCAPLLARMQHLDPSITFTETAS